MSEGCNQINGAPCSVLKSKTLTEASGKDIKPEGIHGPVVIKAPVVLAEKIVQVDVESKIKLNEPTFEVKRIKKDVYLTQCKLIPGAGITSCGPNGSGKLFIEGFVRKNIEYATIDNTGRNGVCGDIKHTTVDVPFQVVTVVNYEVPPQIEYRGRSKEVNYYEDCHCGCGEDFMGKFGCQQGFEDKINFVEKPYCELIDAKIFEEDIHKNLQIFEEACHVKMFDTIVEKMVVYIKLKVLQVQQIHIPGHKPAVKSEFKSEHKAECKEEPKKEVKSCSCKEEMYTGE